MNLSYLDNVKHLKHSKITNKSGTIFKLAGEGVKAGAHIFLKSCANSPKRLNLPKAQAYFGAYCLVRRYYA